MSESLNLPNQTAIGGECIDNVLQIIQAALSALPWLQQSLGRIVPQTLGKKTEPWLYKGAGEYYRAYPNDTLQSFSCLLCHDDEKYEPDGIFARRTLSVIVWANLQTLGIDPPTVEGLKKDVRSILRELDCVMAVLGSKDQTVSGAEAIYPNFDVSEFKETYLTYPYGGFRMEVVVHFADLCY